MKKERYLSTSQAIRQIFEYCYYEVEEEGYVNEVIANYNKMSHPHAKLTARRLAKKLYRANRKEFGYPLRAQSKAKKMRHFTKVKGYV